MTDHQQTNMSESVDYKSGSIRYEAIGEGTEGYNPIVIVNGYLRGSKAARELAEHLSQNGKRKVIIADQPDISVGESVLDSQARALLAVLSDNNLADRPIDFVGHSFGCLILVRAAQIAQQEGLSMVPFDVEAGSHSVFLAPAGSNENESLYKLANRFHKQLKQNKNIGNWERKDLKQEVKNNVRSQPMKYLREALVLSRTLLPYAELAELGLQPTVFSYPDDILFPYELSRTSYEKEAEAIGGVAMPISPHGTHNDNIFNPEPTAKAILQQFDQRIKGPAIDLQLSSAPRS